MNLKKRSGVHVLLLIIILVNPIFGQTFIGLTGGLNMGRSVFDDKNFNEVTESQLTPGWQIGATFLLERKEKFIWSFEIQYANIGRSVESKSR